MLTIRDLNKFFVLIFFLAIFNGVYFFVGKYLIDEKYKFSQKIQAVIQKTIPALNLSQQLAFNLTELRRLQLMVFIIDETPSYYEERRRDIIKKNNDILVKYSGLTESQEEEFIFKRLNDNWQLYVSSSSLAELLWGAGEKEKAIKVMMYDSLVYLIAFEKENKELITENSNYIISFSALSIFNENKTIEVFYTVVVINLFFQLIVLTVFLRLYNASVQAVTDANIDPLTNLYNRRKILTEWNKMNASDNNVLIVGDIDHFKMINDNYGHNTGDYILAEVAKHLQRKCRNSDLIARIGGEEFAIISTGSTISEAYLMTESIRKDIEKTSFVSHSGEKINVTISFGISVCSKDDCTFEYAFSLADKKLYQSKNEGRNRTSF